MTDIVVITAHPDLAHSHVNLALMRAASGLPQVQVRDLYALYPDFLIDVATEQAALADARLVVWQHPIHWYHMPPLMQLWLDEVLAFGWAYGPQGRALAGKDLWVVASTGSTAESYRPTGTQRYFFDAFLPAYEQTAAICGLRFLPPLLLHGAHRVHADELNAHVQIYLERLTSYPEWPELDMLEACELREVPAIDRPGAARKEV